MPIPDSTTSEQVKEATRRQWAERAASWREIPGARGVMWQAATDLMIDALAIRPGMQVLDVACGPGEPAISIAAAIAPDGFVTATDLTPEMLTAAEENARKRGIVNITYRLADAEALPFPDDSFDAVTCRFGVMLFPDVQQALGEMRRVLVPEGRVVCMVWGPPEQNAQVRPLDVVRKYVALPQPAPGEPHRFRFSEPDALASHLRTAGFHAVEDGLHHVAMQWHGTAAEQWEALRRNNRRMAAAIAGLPEERQEALTRDVLDAIQAEEGRAGGGMAAVVLATAAR
ncbi:MAG: class I SAM-dependent methyltransferase [Chloroflexota bacterium]|nr:class I SAM-dependent methyltransferase [Chloroflexota bacterium]